MTQTPHYRPETAELEARTAEALHHLGASGVELATSPSAQLENALRSVNLATFDVIDSIDGFADEKRQAYQDPTEIVATNIPVVRAFRTQQALLDGKQQSRPQTLYQETVATSVLAASVAVNSLGLRFNKTGKRKNNQLNFDMPNTTRSGDLTSGLAHFHVIVNGFRLAPKLDTKRVDTLAQAYGVDPVKLGNPITRRRRTADHFAKELEDTGIKPNALLSDVEKVRKSIRVLEDVGLGAELARNLNYIITSTKNSWLQKDQAVTKVLRESHALLANSVSDFIRTGAFDPPKAERLVLNLVTKTEELVGRGMFNPVEADLLSSTAELFHARANLYQSTGELMGFYQGRLGRLESWKNKLDDYEAQLNAEPTSKEESAAPDEPAQEMSQSDETAEHVDRQALIRAEQTELLRNKHDQAVARLIELQLPYSASMTSLRKEKLNLILHSLQMGYQNEYTDQQFVGIEETAAKRIIANLHGLSGEFGKFQSDEAQEKLNAFLTNEADAVTSVIDLRKQLFELGINGFESVNTDVNQSYQWLATNHLALAEVLRKHLPAQISDKYCELLDTLFVPMVIDEVDTSVEPSEPESVETVDALDEAADELTVEDEQPPEIDTVLQFPLKEQDIAHQLDWEIFPREVTLKDIRRATEHSFPSGETEKIEWSRISDLLQLSNAYEGLVYRSKPNTLGNNLPYFVAELNVGGKTFYVAENPQYGNASYVLRADRAAYGAPWQEVFEQTRQFARLLGAEQVVHSPSRKHLDRIMDNIQSQMLIKTN